MADHLVGQSKTEDSFVPKIFFDTCIGYNQVRENGIEREILLSDATIYAQSQHNDIMINEKEMLYSSNI